jgi:VanZ family protein
MKKGRWYICICFILITLLCIFNNSLQSADRSNEQSSRVLEVIEKLFRTLPLDTDTAQHIVRKAAHVAEFALLGLGMALLLILIGKVFRQYIVTMLFIGFISAVMDETVQIFSFRGSQVMDVWFDVIGLLLGMCTMFILHGLWQLHLRKRKYENKKLQVEKKITCEK